MVRTLIRAAAFAALSSCLVPASAQEAFPQRAVTLVVPYVAGGPVDIIGRALSTRLSRNWGKPVVVDNRGGAGGNIGSEYVAHAAPDGYTLLINTPALTINPFFMDKGAVDPQRDLVAITDVGYAPALLLVGAKSPFNTVQDMVKYAKANPGKLNFGSPGTGTSLHLAAELFKQLGGFEATHVPYKGTSQAATDLIAGQIDFTFGPLVASLSQVRGGLAKALAVTSTRRVPQLPQMPTMREAGVKNYEFTLWYGIFAPAKTPPALVEKIHQEVVRALKDPEVKAQLESSSFTIVGDTPAAFAAAMAGESARWAEIARNVPAAAK